MTTETVQFVEMARLVRPVPPELSKRVMELLDDYRRGEVTAEEYNRRFAELDAEARKVTR